MHKSFGYIPKKMPTLSVRFAPEAASTTAPEAVPAMATPGSSSTQDSGDYCKYKLVVDPARSYHRLVAHEPAGWTQNPGVRRWINVIAKIPGGFEKHTGYGLTLRALRNLSPIIEDAVTCAISSANRIASILIPTTTEEALQVVLSQASIDEVRIDPKVGWKRPPRRPYSFLPLWTSYCTARLAKSLDMAELLERVNREFEKLLYLGDGTRFEPECRDIQLMLAFVSKGRKIRSTVIESLAWAIQDKVLIDNTGYLSSYINTNPELVAEIEAVIAEMEAVGEDRDVRSGRGY